MKNAIHRIKHYPADKRWQNQPDTDLSSEQRYPTVEQPRPSVSTAFGNLIVLSFLYNSLWRGTVSPTSYICPCPPFTNILRGYRSPHHCHKEQVIHCMAYILGCFVVASLLVVGRLWRVTFCGTRSPICSFAGMTTMASGPRRVRYRNRQRHWMIKAVFSGRLCTGPPVLEQHGVLFKTLSTSLLLQSYLDKGKDSKRF